MSQETLQNIANAVKRLRVLEERAKQTGPGGLMHFLRYHWDVLEPSRPFVDGWVPQAIAEHLEAVTFGQITRLIINVPPGSMKALDCDTPVFTTWGWKRHGDLLCGDFVFGPDGEPKRVMAAHTPGYEESYEVEFDDGSVIVAGEGHLWEVERDYPYGTPDKRRCRKQIIVTTKELIKSEYREKGFRSTQRPDRIPLAKPLRLPPKTLLIDPYVFGAWLGDGATGSGVIYSAEQDIEHFKTLGRIACTYPATNGRHQDFHRINVENLQVTLRVMGILGNKHIPVDYLEGSIEQRLELVRGLLDTDGCATKENHCSFTSKFEHMAETFAQTLASLGIKPHRRQRYTTLNGKQYGPHYYVNFTPPPGLQVFKLGRKQERIIGSQNERSKGRYVVDIRPVGKRLVNCITVEGSLYLAGKRFITTHNSLMANCFWPAFEWGPMGMPYLRGMSFSYAAHLTERDNDRLRTLVTSKKYQELWGDRFSLTSDAKIKISNNHMGWQLASSVRGISTGERADRLRLDDAHNVVEGESERVRTETVRWFKESMSNRLNDMDKSAIIVIMARVHELDVAGTIIEDSQGMGYEHLCIPMRYETDGPWAKSTKIGWEDPRKKDGELAWPERFSAEVVDNLERDLGPWAFASQMQQSPAPRGGGIIRREWFRLWEHPQNKFPQFDNVVAAVDPAYTEKDENDPSAMSVWGTFRHPETNEFGIMLVHAWRKRLPIHGDTSPKFPGETDKAYERRCSDNWGLVEWIWHSCEMHRVQHLFIESKASGISVFQEIERRQSYRNWATELADAKGDKIARLTSVQPIFSQGLIWAPDRDWADMAINELVNFPKYKFDDICDTAACALKRMREMGLLQFQDEREYEEYVEHNRPQVTMPLYPV